ncbi:MAG: hypothetical protein QNJ31_06815 [Candidatus Caenarcaniphilales bacterium]|nr:hypothetical protein [Candidatus Caenarcaniphilales bacterium]
MFCNNYVKYNARLYRTNNLVTKNVKSSKNSSNLQKNEVLTVAEYAKAFDLPEHSVRSKLKSGELELTHLERNGKKVQAVLLKSQGEKKNNNSKVKAPKLLQVESLKTIDYKELVEDKDQEIKNLNKELNKAEDKINKLEREVERLKEIIKGKSELVASHESLLRSREEKLQALEKLHSEKQTTVKNATVQPKENKKPGFLAGLFGGNKNK